MTATTNPQATGALVVYRPLVEKIVAALGALVTHHFAYLIVPLLGFEGHSAVDHGHLSMQWAVLTPLAVAAVVALTVWQLHSLGFRTATSARELSTWIVGFFLLQEAIEGLLAGHSPLQLLTHPAILAGVFLGPVIGWVISRVLIGVTELAARFFGRPPFGMPPKTELIPIPVRSKQGRAGSRSRPRAPPS